MVGLRKNEKGVSLIALVITIIIVIILAAIAFNSSTSTIGRANYSKFVTNISEVQSAIRQKMVTVKGMMNASGTQVTDGQVYNYVAKGGTSENDILVESKVPDYTVIKKTADIGIKLPSMKVNTPTKTGAEVKYGVTDDGIVFIWPPFPHEEKYYINENETVDASVISDSGDIEIKVAEKTIKIEENENGELETKEIIYEGLTRKEFEEIKEKVKVGGYVNYTPTAVTGIAPDPTKTGYSQDAPLSTDTSAAWRILSIDDETGEVLITTQGPVNSVTLKGATGYLYGANELHRLCESLYTNSTLKLIARSMTIEDLNKACNYTPPTEEEQLRYAWYPEDTVDEKLENIEAGGKMYIAKKHSNLKFYGISNARFYNWDDEFGMTHVAKNENDYNEDMSAASPVLVSRTWYNYNPGASNSVINEILKGNDSNRGWTASSSVYLNTVHDRAFFEIRTPYSENAGNSLGNYLYNSTGIINEHSYGIRPIISFDITCLNTSDTTKDGSQSAAWEIKQN